MSAHASLRRVALALCLVICVTRSAAAATVYLDTNGTSNGSGIASGSTITWDASTIWNTVSDGGNAGTLQSWNSGDIAVFSAGTDAGAIYTVSVTGTQLIGGLTFEESRVTLSSGTLQLAAASNINVANNITATVNSTITGAFDLTKQGSGTLILGGSNTYTGKTILNAGTLSISADANLGTIATPTADAITFSGDSTLQLSGSAPVTLSANRGITIGTGVSANLQVLNAAATLTYGGSITGAAGTTFKKTGAGTLELQGDSSATFVGALNIDAGTLKLSAGGLATGLSSIAISNRSALTLDNTSTNATDRVSAAITSNGGTLNFIGNAVNSTETLGALTLNPGAFTINSTPGAGGSTLTLPSITRNAGSTLYVSGAGLGGGSNQVILTTANTLTNTILPWAVVSNGTVTRFATHAGNGTTLTPQTTAASYQAAETAWTANTVNALPTATQTLTANRTIYSLTLDNGVNLAASTSDRTLTIGSGGIGAVLQTGGTSTVGQTGTIDNILAFGTNEALFNVLGTLTIVRADSTAGLTGSGGLTKSGAGTLILGGQSTLTGTYRINEGILEVRRGDSMNSSAQAIHLNGGTLRLSADASTTFAGNLTLNYDSTIQVDRVTPAATATTLTVGTINLTSGRTLFVNSNDITAGTAYTLTAGTATLSGPATIDVANNDVGQGTMNTAGWSGAFQLTKTGLGDLVTTNISTGYSGAVDIQAGRVGWGNTSGTVTEGQLLMGAGGILKSGAGSVNLTNANTFTGGITVTAGVLGFTTVSDNNGAPSSLGQGTDGITLGGGTLSFVGSANQSTNRSVTFSAASTLGALGTSGATIAYTGAINPGANNFTLVGTGTGIISGGLTQTGITADGAVNSGTWTFNTNTVTVADDLTIVGSGTVLNVNTTLAFGASADATLQIQNGGVVNLGANDLVTVAGGADRLLVGQATTGAIAVLNTAGFNLSAARLDLGQVATGLEGNIIGTGTLSGVTDFNLYRGTIEANLAGSGTLDKQGPGIVTLKGDNTGLTGSNTVLTGQLILDYSVNNATKLATTASLDMRGSVLTLNGSSTAPTVQNVASFTLANGGANTIELFNGTGQSITLNLGAITRANSAGTVRFKLPTSGAITTTTVNNATTGLLGTTGTAFATIADATGTYFAKNDGSGNIVPVTYSGAKNNITTWLPGDNITDATTGFTGSVDCVAINSLRYDAAGPSTVTITSGGAFNIASGGILQTSNVTAGASTITGGKLTSGTAELVIRTDSATQPLIITSSFAGNTAITKTGNGSLQLTGTNTSTGQLQLEAGTIIVSGGNAIGDSSLVTLADDQTNTLQMLNNETVGALAGGNATAGQLMGTVDIGSNTLTISGTGQSGNQVYSGVITGSGSIVKYGSGTNTNQQFAGASTGFTGTVTVNAGLFYLEGLGALNASSITVNKGASFLISNNTSIGTGSRLLDTASIILNSADGAWSGETRPSGLAIRRDQASTLNETIGVLSINSGANYARLEATATSAIAQLITDNITRSNNATFDVRGTNMSATANQRSQLRIVTAANQTAFINSMIGGGSVTLGTKNISIVPWAIAEEFTSGIADTNMGNSLATYVSGQGFRALTYGTEYNTYTASSVATENIRESLTADLTGLAGKTINALVLNNNNTTASTINVTGTGAGQTLTVTSGAMLFTLNTGAAASSANNIVLGGFNSGITVGSTNEYIFHVVNPSSVATTATLQAVIASPLTSTADITKSGRGTLTLTSVNTAGGGSTKTTINEGMLQISDLDNIGGNTGGLVFAGGTLKLAAASASPAILDYSGDDISTRTITFLQGGGTLDTNGFNLALANTLGSGIGGFTKAGAGNLTLNASTTLTGSTTAAAGTLTLRAAQAIGTGDLTVAAGATLDIGSFNQTVGNVTLPNSATAALIGTGTLTGSGTMTLNQGALQPTLAGNFNLIKQTASVTATISSTANTFTGYTHVQDGVLSITSIADAGTASSLGAATGDNANIRLGNVTTTGTLLYTGAAASTNRSFMLTGTTGGGIIDNDGTGALTLNGTIIGNEAGAKTLTLQGATTGFSNVLNSSIDECIATLSLTKTEAGTWVLATSNDYSGITTITAGTLQVNAATGGLGNSTASNAITLNGGILSLRNDGSGNNGSIIYGSASNPAGYKITLNATSTINVDNLTANSGNSVVLGALSQASASARTLNVTGSNGYSLTLASLGLDPSTGQTTTLVPTTANLIVAGNVTNPMTGFSASNFDTVVLDGTSTGNAVNGSISDAAGGSIAAGGTTRVTKSNTSTWTLNGTSTYTGVTSVSGGNLQVTQSSNGMGDSITAAAVTLSGGTLSLLNDGAGNNGTIIYGSTSNVGGYNVTVSGATTINVDQLTANTGNTVQLGNLTISNTLNVTGAHGYNLTFAGSASAVTASSTLNPTSASLAITGPVALTAGQTLTLSGSTTGNSIGAINSTTGLLTKLGTSTWTLNGANTYTGTTSINQGTLAVAVDQNLAGALNFGTSNAITTTGTLDLSNASATFGGAMLVQTNTASADTATIGSGKSLTINNNATFGSGATNSVTQFNATGAGTFNVTNATAGNGFLVGNSNTNVATADFSGLAAMNVSLNNASGVLQVSSTSGTNSTGYGNLILAANSTITASAITIGGGGSYNGNVGQINTLKLGSGINTLNVTALNIGTGIRDLGSITFNSPSSGSLIVRAADGSSAAAFNMGTGSATTGVALNGNQNTFDVSGHNADLLFTAINIGTQNRNSDLTNVFSFGQGTLSAQSLTMSTKGSNGFATTSTMNLSGGTVNIGTGSGTAITLATNSGSGTATASINITGGAVTVTGAIAKGNNTGTGSSTGTITLNGGSLDMSGFAIGSSTNLIAFNVQSGGLSNLAQLNGGAALIKTTSGTLNIGGTNAYTGATNVQDGRVILVGGSDNRIATSGSSVLGNGTTSGILQLGSAAGKSDQTLASLSTGGTGTANAVVGGNANISTLTLNQTTDATFNGSLGGSGANENRLSLIKNGAGALTVTGTNSLAGSVSVNAGTLNVAAAGLLGTNVASVSVGDGASLNLEHGNTIQQFTGSGNVVTLGSSTGSRVGFTIDGATNDRINLTSGQTLTANGTILTDIFVNTAPTLSQYVLINSAADGSFLGSGSFSIGTIVNGGSYIYNIARETTGNDQLLLNITFQAAPPDVWWKGDLTGTGTGVWSASAIGGNTNWDTDATSGIDGVVPPDSGSVVHFNATGAANFATTLGADVTIKKLIFESGSGTNGVTVGGTDTLTIGSSTVTGSGGLDVAAGGGNITISAQVALGVDQSWNITDSTSTLTVTGAVSGLGSLAVNDNGTALGTLVLGGNNTYAGTTLVSAGVLQIGNGGTTGSFGAGAVTNNASIIFNLGAGADQLISNAISGTGSITKIGSGAVTLSGANTYTGKTTISGGTVKISSESNLGNNPATATADQLSLSGGGTLQTTASFTIDDTNRGIFLGAGGGGINTNSGTTLTMANSITGADSLTKSGAGTLNFTTAQSYTGSTIVDQGTLTSTVTQSMTGALVIGASATSTNSANLDLSTANMTFAGGTNVQNNSATANTVTIGAGRTLTLNGNVTVGSSALSGVTNTNLTATGAGTFNITNATSGGVVQIGGYSNSTAGNGNRAIADFSGLSTLNIALNTSSSTIRISNTSSGNTSGSYATMVLAANSSLTSATLNIGDGAQFNSVAGQINALKLGSGTNTINTNTINIGTGTRDYGSLTFNTTNGTVTIRNAAGSGRANLNIATSGGNTGTVSTEGNTFDVTGHNADLLLGTVNIGTQNRGNNLLNTFSFNQGTLDMTSLAVSIRTGNPSTGTIYTTTSNVNIGGGTVSIQNGITDLARTTGAALNAGTAVTGTINFTGGTITIGQTGGTSVNMATAATGTTATAALNISGTANVTMNGDMLRAGGAGTSSASFTLNGGSLDMTGHIIGNATNTIAVTTAAGTLQNVQQINGGGTLDKTTTGTLILTGVNAYTGNTTVSAGVLRAQSNTALGAADGSVGTGTSVANNAALELSGGISVGNEALTLNGSGVSSGGALRSVSGNNSFAGNITLATASRINTDVGTLTLDVASGNAISGTNTAVTFGGAGNTVVADAISTGTGTLIKDGSGTLVLSGTNSYTGSTTVSNGTLQVGSGGNGSTASGSAVTVSGASAASTVLAGSGTVGGSTLVVTGTLSPGDTGGSAVGTLTFGNNLTVNSGSTINLKLTAADSAADANLTNFLSSHAGSTTKDYLDSLSSLPSSYTDHNNLNDFLSIGGTLNIGTNGTVTFVNGITTEQQGDIFHLIDWNTLGAKNLTSAFTGTFTSSTSDFVLPSLSTSGLTWDVSAFKTYGIVSIVPEPGRALLLMIGITSLVFRRRR